MLYGKWLEKSTVITYAENGTTFSATIVNGNHDRRIPAHLAALYQSGLTKQPASIHGGAVTTPTAEWILHC
jgi:hypothetical protein